MLYLTCTMISSVDFAHYGVSRAKDWISVDCGTICVIVKRGLINLIIVIIKAIQHNDGEDPRCTVRHHRAHS